MPRLTSILVFDTFQILDATGPSSVLGAANDLIGRQDYAIGLVSERGGLVRSNCGIGLQTEAVTTVAPQDVDSAFIVGGDPDGLTATMRSRPLRDWMTGVSMGARRYGSVCSGSSVLAAWGLIGTRRFATHWAAVPGIRKHWPDLALDPEAIFVADGPLWTSAGITTGIDMFLAIVEEDHGPEAARAIAQRLVLSGRRPGWQSQFSAALDAQGGRRGRYADLIAWIRIHLAAPLGVEILAERAGETLRSFHRNFADATGRSPAAFVARLRIDRARELIGEGLPLKRVAEQTGHADVARLSAAFQRTFGMTASAYRLVHQGS